ncbi:MAG: UDP-3-O-(3-hydroxymyristoyl)glucosamine N-acyltransferase [Spirulinaceae cyanobacterium]
MKFSEILKHITTSRDNNSLSQHQELDPEINAVAAVDEAQRGTLSYIEGKGFSKFLEKTAASALILPLDVELQQQANEKGIAWVATPQPRLAFAKAIALFYQPWQPTPGIHPSAVIDPGATIGKEVYIAPNVVISAGVIIGAHVSIYANVVIYPQVEIGAGTTLHANCTIHERSKIGANCFINSGAVIGAEGFGFVHTPEGLYKMPQSGYVVLEDDVEVACNTAIDRPALGETRIGKNTKIDNLVQIAHGCQIGSNCAISGQSGMSGGVELGNRVILAGQVGISNKAKLGDGAIATAKAGIHKNVESGQIISGTPAIPHQVFLKAAAIYQRLPEMYKTLKHLKKYLNEDS